MRKLIAAINISLDGFCDHDAGIADEALHDHYTELIKSGDAILYGRITYQLMEYWPTVLKNPTGDRSMDEFALAIDDIEKIVFSHTLKTVDWRNTRIATKSIEEEISALKQQAGRDIFVGSPSMILAATKLNLIDEYQLCVHPVIAGKGLPLFKDIAHKIELSLIKTKTLPGGQVILYYQPAK